MDWTQKATDFEALPRACPEGRRVDARIKAEPEDFQVEEVPIYRPCGEGEHLFLWVEKRNLAGADLIKLLGHALCIGQGDIGVAGTKDKRAVTRQWVSVPLSCEAAARGLALYGVKVLDAIRHRNKLRLGHLAGNRFSILLRGAPREALDDLERTAGKLETQGFFNLYGPQRFGIGNRTLQDGLRMLQGQHPRSGPFERRMRLSAVQAALFNLYVAMRVEAGIESKVLRGDVMSKVATGGLFVVEDAAVEQARLDAGETRITGPMFGHKMMAARYEAGEFEEEVLRAAGMTLDDFRPFSKLAEGTRRSVWTRPEGTIVTPADEGIWLSFYLPSGSYASVMLREFVNHPEEAER